MAESEDSDLWESQGQTSEKRFWEHGFEESKSTFERQNEAIDVSRQTLMDFLRYHFIFVGFVLAAAKFGPSGSIELQRWEIIITIIPAFLGITITTAGHHSLGSYRIGYEDELYYRTKRESDSYVGALKSLSSHYQDLTDRNREQLDDHQKYITWNAVLFGVSFGALLTVILI